jgi:hypothetical protein
MHHIDRKSRTGKAFTISLSSHYTSTLYYNFVFYTKTAVLLSLYSTENDVYCAVVEQK